MKAFLLICVFFVSQNNELLQVRKKYPAASETKESSAAFLSSLSHIGKSDSQTLLAYKGAALTLQAKYTGKIADKKKHFHDGATLVEQAIEVEPTNIEIRMIRLSIQENTPKIVNYKKNISQDKDFIVQNLNSQNRALRDYVLNYALKSKSFSDAEKALLRK